MRQKELRLALVCYGGISLAVYMHGITKEVWKLARASTHGALPAGLHSPLSPAESAYAALLNDMAARSGVRLSVLPDIVAGASAGGMNGVFLAQAIASGQSLEPLTRMWLERADIDVLLAPDARRWTGFAKQWAVPLVRYLMSRGDVPGEAGTSPAEEEIRAKLARFVRSRWFEAPFSGIGFSRLIAGALDAMAAQGNGAPLLPAGHPLDLFTTATDYAGHAQHIALHSPPSVEEREHRVGIGFHAQAGDGTPLAALPELVFAARATASFPGAFPPLQVGEIDALMAERRQVWPGRDAFLARILPAHAATGELDTAALMDGSVLVNAPFAQAIAALPARPAEHEIDRRLVYIDPTQPPAPVHAPVTPGFFSVIFRALSTIPREQPIRDNLNALARQSARHARARAITAALRPDIERQVRVLLGEGLAHARPDARQLRGWRAAAQEAAARQAGYAYHAYARLKLEGTLDALAGAIAGADGPAGLALPVVRGALGRWAAHNLRLTPTEESDAGGLSSELIAFLRAHDGAYRVRRLRHLAQRLDDMASEAPAAAQASYDIAREAVWHALSQAMVATHPAPAEPAHVLADPGAILREMAAHATFAAVDDTADAAIAAVLPRLPSALAQGVLLAYLGFAFHDVATLALARGDGLQEAAPVKVDRISPRDARLQRRLKGEEFHHFAAFFSRTYREHDYLLGRLHGAERLVDLLGSSMGCAADDAQLMQGRARLFAAILAEEEERLLADPELIVTIGAELDAAGLL